MKISRLISTLKDHEGAVIKNGRHMPYKDTVSKLTIGYGRNLTDRGISEAEAMYLLQNDLQDVIEGLRKAYYWFDSLDEVRQEVVINMAFNLGLAGFAKFRNTIAYISEGNYRQASENMLQSKWATQVGYRARELSREMETGISV
jgi:lysozyme